MKIKQSLILLLFLSTSQAEESDGVKRVKAKFLVNYQEMCIDGGEKHELDKVANKKRCACQVKQFDENLNYTNSIQ